MPARVSVIVVAFVEKQGPVAFVIAGEYGFVVPAIGVRHVPALAFVAVTDAGAIVPGMHDVVAIGAVQSAK
jgi:hypothetical protein